MTTQEILKGLTTENLIMKLKDIKDNMKLMVLNVAIQEELETRISEEEIDTLMGWN